MPRAIPPSSTASAPIDTKNPSKKDTATHAITDMILPILASLVAFIFLPAQVAIAMSIGIIAIVYYASKKNAETVKKDPEKPPSIPDGDDSVTKPSDRAKKTLTPSESGPSSKINKAFVNSIQYFEPDSDADERVAFFLSNGMTFIFPRMFSNIFMTGGEVTWMEDKKGFPVLPFGNKLLTGVGRNKIFTFDITENSTS